MNFLEKALAIRDETIAMRRDLHRYPELGLEEVRTAGLWQAADGLGIEVTTGIGKTGVVGLLRGARIHQFSFYGLIWTLCRSPRKRALITLRKFPERCMLAVMTAMLPWG